MRLETKLIKQQPSKPCKLGGMIRNRGETKVFTMTNVRLKEVATKATKTDFYNQFFTAARITSIIGYFGQLISALTEFHFIFSIFNGSYNPFNQYSNILPFIGGLLGIYIFEYLGVRIYLVRIIRQIVNKDFQGSERKVLFTFNLLFVIALCGSNLLTSWLGQKYSFDTVTNVTVTDETHVLELEKTAKIEAIQKRYDKQLTDLKTDYNEQVEAIEKRYKTDIYNLKNNRFAARENKAKYNNYTAQIDSKLKAKTTDLSNLKTQFNTDKEQLKQTFTDDKNNVFNAFDNRINDISKTEKSKINLMTTVQEYTLPILLAFILLSWFAIVYTEIFIKGSGQKIEVQEVKKRPVLIVILLLGLYEKLYLALYWLVAKIVGTKKYIFDDIKKEVVRYELKQQQQQLATGFRQIGFVNKKSNTGSNPTNVSNTAAAKTVDFSNLKTNNDNRITKVVQVENRQCKNCKKGFVYKHHKQLYCSDKCRIENWEKRTGKKLKKRSKK